MSFTLGKLADLLSANFIGDGNYQIYGIKDIDNACANYLSFIHGAKYACLLDGNNAGALLITQDLATNYAGNAIIVDNVYLAYAKASQLFSPKCKQQGIALSTKIDQSSKIGANVAIGANVVIDDNCVIGNNVQIGANTVIGAGCTIGDDCIIYSNVTFYHDVKIGNNVIIHSGAVIGADGFGFAKDEQKVWHKIAQLGGVVIGNNVEIGANTTIDRGALKNTIIGDGVKLDNQIMIAHNVEIGANTALAACCGISGSTKIGKNCMLAGGVGLVGHIEICDDVFITGMTMVTHSITEPGSYSSGTAMQTTMEWKKSAAQIRKLPKLAKKIIALEKQLQLLLNQTNQINQINQKS